MTVLYEFWKVDGDLSVVFDSDANMYRSKDEFELEANTIFTNLAETIARRTLAEIDEMACPTALQNDFDTAQVMTVETFNTYNTEYSRD